MSGISANASAKAAEMARLASLKKGKTPEQVRVIDFFLTEEINGCLKKQKSSSLYTVEEYQQLVARKCESLNLRQKALEKIGLDESQIQEIQPVCLSSFVFSNNNFDHDVMIKIKGDVAVSSQFSVTWIFFSSTQLYTYQFIFDMVSDSTVEYTKDYFYSDITCISTSREIHEKITSTLVSGCLKKDKENITKSLYTVDSLHIIVPGSSYAFSMRNSTDVERSIQAVKAMIRDKKYSV